MHSLSSGILIAEIIGGATGALIVDYLSKEHKEIKKNLPMNLLIGAVTGSIIAALGTTLFIVNNTGATLGALVGLIGFTKLKMVYSAYELEEIESIVKFMMAGAFLGYTSSSILNYAVSSIFHRI